MAISIAPLLKQQSPSRHFGHGWIELPSGKRWNPSRSKADLLAGLYNQKQEKSWQLKLFPRLFR